MGEASDIADKAGDAATGIAGLIPIVETYPKAAICVLLAVAFLLCFLPNGVFAQLIIRNTELRKLDERQNISRKKLTDNRQNRRK